MESVIEQDILKGYNLAIIDPKGDIDLFSKVIQASAESGRLEEVMLLTPIYPDHSVKLDPLSHYYMEDELVDHVVSGIKAKEDYFIAIASEVTGAVVSGLALKAKRFGKDLNANFSDIKSRVTYKDLQDLKQELLLIKDALPEVVEVCDNIDQILSSTQEFFSKVASSLRTMLSALSSGNTGKIIGKSYVNEFVARFEEGKGVILYCNTGSLLARRTAHIIGRVLISMIQSMVGRFFASGRKLDPPLCIHIDEGHNIAYMGIQELFSKGGRREHVDQLLHPEHRAHRAGDRAGGGQGHHGQHQQLDLHAGQPSRHRAVYGGLVPDLRRSSSPSSPPTNARGGSP